MARRIVNGNDIGYTILPYDLDRPIEQDLVANPSDRVLGYVSAELKFFSAESTGFTEAADHWSLDILKESPYCEEKAQWIVYSCAPEKTTREFGKILGNYAQSLHLYNWDIWGVMGKNGLVAVVTDWERY